MQCRSPIYTVEALSLSVCVDISDETSRRNVAAIKAELLDLQCMEEKYLALLDLVNEPFNSVASCRLPPAVSDLSDFGFQVRRP